MKLFRCDHCGHLLYFENTRCERCGRALGYGPLTNSLFSLVGGPGIAGQGGRRHSVPRLA